MQMNRSQLRSGVARAPIKCTSRSVYVPSAVAPARTSLVQQTLEDMAVDTDQQQHLARLAQLGQAALTREEARTRQRSLDGLGVPPFPQSVKVSSRLSLHTSPGAGSGLWGFQGVGTRQCSLHSLGVTPGSQLLPDSA